MKRTRTHQFATPGALWLVLWQEELDALDGLPPWATRLFIVIVRLSDFTSGFVRTSIGELLNALQPDQPERGPRLEVVSRWQLEDMLRQFHALNICLRDKETNEKRKGLFFLVRERTRPSSSAGKLQGQFQGRAKAAKRATARVAAGHPLETPGTTPGVFQRMNTNPPTPLAKRDLSTATKPSKHVTEALQRTRAKLNGH